MKAVDEARRRGIKRRGFERWLHGLDDASDGKLLAKFSTSKNAHLWVNVRVLESVAGPTARQREQEIHELRGRMEEAEARIIALWKRLERAEAGTSGRK